MNEKQIKRIPDAFHWCISSGLINNRKTVFKISNEIDGSIIISAGNTELSDHTLDKARIDEDGNIFRISGEWQQVEE